MKKSCDKKLDDKKLVHFILKKMRTIFLHLLLKCHNFKHEGDILKESAFFSRWSGTLATFQKVREKSCPYFFQEIVFLAWTSFFAPKIRTWKVFFSRWLDRAWRKSTFYSRSSFFSFILLIHEGSHREFNQEFQPSYDIFRRWCQGLFRPQVPCIPSLHCPIANSASTQSQQSV